MTKDKILNDIQKNNRICPLPQHWNNLYKILLDKKRSGNGWEPALPLILAAWWETSPLGKIVRFKEHIEWVDKHGCLEEIASFLSKLTEEQWIHLEIDVKIDNMMLVKHLIIEGKYS